MIVSVVTCPPLPLPNGDRPEVLYNTTAVGGEYRVGTRADFLYQCNGGRRYASGFEPSICGASGEWSRPSPRCISEDSLNYKNHLIQLIRQQKIQIKMTLLRFGITTFWSSVSLAILTIVLKCQLWLGDTKKAFNCLQLCFTSSSWIQLVCLIKQIYLSFFTVKLYCTFKAQICLRQVLIDLNIYIKKN